MSQTSAPAAPEASYLNNFVLIPDLFTPEECRKIVYLNEPSSQAHVIFFDGTSEDRLVLNQRNTKVKVVPRGEPCRWIYTRVVDYVREINQQYFKFQLHNLTDFQILEYENTGFYNTHLDIGTGDTSRRKLSLVAFLTPREEYEGGELFLRPNFPPIEQKQGAAVIFPSYVPHEIKPVTKGVRHSLVTWVLGPCFK